MVVVMRNKSNSLMTKLFCLSCVFGLATSCLILPGELSAQIDSQQTSIPRVYRRG